MNDIIQLLDKMGNTNDVWRAHGFLGVLRYCCWSLPNVHDMETRGNEPKQQNKQLVASPIVALDDGNDIVNKMWIKSIALESSECETNVFVNKHYPMLFNILSDVSHRTAPCHTHWLWQISHESTQQ